MSFLRSSVPRAYLRTWAQPRAISADRVLVMVGPKGHDSSVISPLGTRRRPSTRTVALGIAATIAVSSIVGLAAGSLFSVKARTRSVPPVAVTNSYVASGFGTVYFIQWRVVSGTVSGTARVVH